MGVQYRPRYYYRIKRVFNNMKWPLSLPSPSSSIYCWETINFLKSCYSTRIYGLLHPDVLFDILPKSIGKGYTTHLVADDPSALKQWYERVGLDVHHLPERDESSERKCGLFDWVV